MGKLARFTFHTLTIPLIYSSIAVAVSIESMGDYWFVVVGAFVVLGISYLVATVLRHCFISIDNEQDFQALRVAATFPNIVSLPILIFPSLCEFAVVSEGYFRNGQDHESDDPTESLERQCIAQSTTMIFMYFFSWSVVFWSFGNSQLMYAASKHSEAESNEQLSAERYVQATESSEDKLSTKKIIAQTSLRPSIADDVAGSSMDMYEVESSSTQEESILQEQKIDITECNGNVEIVTPEIKSPDTNTVQSNQQSAILRSMYDAFKKTVTSPGFLAMVAGFLTACIAPLQAAMFESGGAIRFFGSAMETLGMATTPISTMVVAGSLVPIRRRENEAHSTDAAGNGQESGETIQGENPIMSDPNFGPYNRRADNKHQRRRSSRFQSFSNSVRSGSIRMLQAVPRSSPEMLRLHIWFCLSRLVITPAAIVGIIVALDCSGSGILNGVPNLAKLVLIVNSALPGALIIIVLLKAKEEMAETAAAVAKVYMPSYILSIFTIAVWTAIGLWVTLPDENGLTVCERR